MLLPATRDMLIRGSRFSWEMGPAGGESELAVRTAKALARRIGRRHRQLLPVIPELGTRHGAPDPDGGLPDTGPSLRRNASAFDCAAATDAAIASRVAPSRRCTAGVEEGRRPA